MATQQDLTRLVVSLEARIDKFDKAMKRAEGISAKSTKKIESNFERLQGRMAGFAKGFLAGFTFEAVARFAQKAINDLADLGDQAKRTGTDVEKLQKILFAAMQEGVEASAVTAALNKLTLELGEAGNKGNDLGKILAANNIELSKLSDPVDALKVIADLMKNAANEQERALIGQAAFGKGYRELLPLLKDGSAAIKAGEQAAVEWGAVADRELIAKAQQFDDAWDAAWAGFETRSKSAIVRVIDWLAPLLETLQEGRIELDATGRPRIKGTFVRHPPNPRVGTPDKTTVVPPLGTSGKGKTAKEEWADAIEHSDELVKAMEEFIDTMDEAREMTRGFFSDLIQGLREGASLTETLGKAFENLADKMINRLLDQAVDQLLGPTGSPGMGLLGSLLGISGKDQSRITPGTPGTPETAGPTAPIIPVTEKLIPAVKKAADDWKVVKTEVLPDMIDLTADAARKAGFDVKNDPVSIIEDIFNKVDAIPTEPTTHIPMAKIFDAKFGNIFDLIKLGIFGRQHGGPVSPGRPYLVGEGGPELFMPRTPGVVVPKGGDGAFGAGKLVVVSTSPYFDVRVGSIAARGDARTLEVGHKRMPSRMSSFQKLGT